MNINPNIFINSGIRCKVDTGLLQEKNIKILGYAIGYFLAEEFEYSCPILIATDTRPSGNKIKNTLIEGLIAFGHDIFDAGICPTPFVAKALKDYQGDDEVEDDETENDESFFTLGLVITASHNPAEYNGIKILTPFGYLDIAIEEEITSIFHTFEKNPALMHEDLPDESGYMVDFDLKSWYQTEILNIIEKNNEKISIVLDCAHGATAQIAPQIFQAFDYNVIAINNSLDGRKINLNSGCSNTAELIKAVQVHQAQWGCAFDGDGDRVIIVDQHSNIFDGDDIIATLSQHPNYKNNSIIVGSIMTNMGLEKYLQQQHKKLIRTQVGERNIIQALIQYQAFLGSETCGHVTIMDHAFCSDGIFTALMFLQTITQNLKTLDKKLTKYFQNHTTIPLSKIQISKNEIEKIVKNFENNYTARFVVRASNTEPILRIMIENEDEQKAEQILQELIKNLTTV